MLNKDDKGLISTPAWQEDFKFDPMGNWDQYVNKTNGHVTLDQPRTHNPVNEIETIGGSGSLISQDAAGNMSKAPKPADWNSAFTMKYDAWNRLTQVKAGSKVMAEYAYNGLKWRISKTAGGETWKYFYTSDWQVVEERVNDAITPDRQFVWGLLGKDNLILRDRPGTSERRYALSDYVSVTAITDATGAVRERYGYHAYGTPLFMDPNFAPISGSTSEWETLYDSYRHDPETGFYQVRNRYLHPTLGRWITRDPIGYEDGVNLYAYARNRPTDAADPMGTFAVLIGIGCEALLILILIALALGISLYILIKQVMAQRIPWSDFGPPPRRRVCFYTGQMAYDTDLEDWACVYVCSDGTYEYFLPPCEARIRPDG